MPSSVVDGEVSYSILYQQTHFFLTPKMFGSVCFVHNIDHHKIKLDPHALKSFLDIHDSERI